VTNTKGFPGSDAAGRRRVSAVAADRVLATGDRDRRGDSGAPDRHRRGGDRREEIDARLVDEGERCRAGIASDRWSLVAFANNVFDEDYLQEVIPAPEFGGSFIHPGTERRVGVEATLKF